MQLEGAGIQTSDFSITARPTLPPPHPVLFNTSMLLTEVQYLLLKTTSEMQRKKFDTF